MKDEQTLVACEASPIMEKEARAMWTPLHAGLGGKDPPRINVASEHGTAAQFEELLAGLSWFDRILVRVGIRWLRRIVITVIGLTLLLIGFIMIIGPGPATVVIPLGLAILGLEYAWARHLLRRLKGYVDAGITQGSAWLGLGKVPTISTDAGLTSQEPDDSDSPPQ